MKLWNMSTKIGQVYNFIIYVYARAVLLSQAARATIRPARFVRMRTLAIAIT